MARPFKNEDAFRNSVVRRLREKLGGRGGRVVLSNKNVNDIVVSAGKRSQPIAFFVEVKYYRSRAGRIGLGYPGGGFQQEILSSRPRYFERYLRWLIGSEDGRAVLVDTDTLLKHVAGGHIGTRKQNNIRPSILDVPGLAFPIAESADVIAKWITRRA